MSFFPYFTWVLLIITVTTIAVQIREFTQVNTTYVWLTDILFVAATLTELILKVSCYLLYTMHLNSLVLLLQILAKGLFLNPNAAISSIWDLLDWIIVVATFTLPIIHFVHCPVMSLSIVVAYEGLPSWIQ